MMVALHKRCTHTHRAMCTLFGGHFYEFSYRREQYNANNGLKLRSEIYIAWHRLSACVCAIAAVACFIRAAVHIIFKRITNFDGV